MTLIHPDGVFFLVVIACFAAITRTMRPTSVARCGLNGFALPVADTAKPFSVQRSVCNAAGLSARRTQGTANRAAEPTRRNLPSQASIESCLRNQKETPSIRMGFSFWLWQHASHLPSLCYVSDERSSLGKRGERCLTAEAATRAQCSGR